ncbi:MAG: site-2 protease family protein [Anaerolineae bacterium]
MENQTIRPKLHLKRDQIIWIVIGLAFLAYAIFIRKLSILELLAIITALVLGITVHECSHAWMANYLGDPTAKLQGRISLNPLRHLDPMGTAMMALTIVTGVGIGWGKPTPVAPYRLRYGQRLGSALVAIAGPISNIIMATFFGIWIRLAAILPEPLLQVFFIIAYMNAILAVFNLLPIPPLDGYSVLIGLISLIRTQWAWQITNTLESFMRYGPIAITGLILATQLLRINILGALIGAPATFLIRLITGF